MPHEGCFTDNERMDALSTDTERTHEVQIATDQSGNEYDQLTRTPCANLLQSTTGRQNCQLKATLICGKCHLVAVSTKQGNIFYCAFRNAIIIFQHVQYCSKDCQLGHWPTHKVDCNSQMAKQAWEPRWTQENREPAFVGSGPSWQPHGALKFLWGNMQAFDILNLSKNEGSEHQGNLSVCFAGKLRHYLLRPRLNARSIS